MPAASRNDSGAPDESIVTRDRDAASLHQFIAHAPSDIALFDPNMRYLAASRGWIEHYGIARDPTGRSHYEVFPEMPERWKDVHRRALAGEVLRAADDRFERADGSVQWISWEARPWYNAQGECAGIVLFTEDVTRQHQSEQALSESERRYRELVELSPDAVTVRVDGLLVFANPAACAMLDAPGPSALLGREAHAFLVPEDVPLAQERTRRILGEGWVAPAREVRIRTLSGRHIDVEVTASRVEHQGRVAVQAIMRDITERKRRDERTTRSRRLESLGTLATGIAHDFNNLLLAIRANVDTARARSANQRDTQECLEHIGRAAERASALVEQILRFARPLEPLAGPVAIGALAEEVVQLVRRAVPPMVRIRTSIAGDLPVLHGNTAQIHQVLMNVMTNALQALGRGPGEISVEADVMQGILGAAGTPARDAVRIRISDTGSGMDALTRERMFDPFFTTRPAGDGTGLGLSIVHGIVHEHGGHIDVVSSPGQGTVFDLYFPVREIAQDRTAEALAPVEVPPARILFIDDDPLVNFAMSSLLRESGHEVTAIQDPAAALDRLHERPHDFDIVLVDFAMPVMTGLEFARAARTVRGDLPIVLTSGNFEPADRQEAQALGITQLLHKPYDMTALAHALGTAAPSVRRPR